MNSNLDLDIRADELEAARKFLTSVRDEDRRAKLSKGHAPMGIGGVIVRNGITRARGHARKDSAGSA